MSKQTKGLSFLDYSVTVEHKNEKPKMYFKLDIRILEYLLAGNPVVEGP